MRSREIRLFKSKDLIDVTNAVDLQKMKSAPQIFTVIALLLCN